MIFVLEYVLIVKKLSLCQLFNYIRFVNFREEKAVFRHRFASIPTN